MYSLIKSEKHFLRKMHKILQFDVVSLHEKQGIKRKERMCRAGEQAFKQ